MDIFHRQRTARPSRLSRVGHFAGLFWLLSSLTTLASPPNVVIILADDVGYADLGCYGNRFHETPRIDRLAAEGLRWTQFYAGPVCSPTRANLQSGQHPARFGITQHIPGHRRPFARLIDPPVTRQLPLEVTTIAESLAATGYATGYFGKWHLGGPGYGPAEQGWQTTLVCQGNTQPPAVTGDRQRRTAEFLTAEAIRFIETHREQPFLLQVSHFAVHIPLSTTPRLLAKYRSKPPVDDHPSRPEYAGLLEELDRSVGEIVDAIDRLGLGRQTLVWFISDNGGLVHDQAGNVYTSNAPLRGEKGTLYEGGIRVPAIARWTDRIAAGTTADALASTIDVHPTLRELAGAPPPEAPSDGVSLTEIWADPPAIGSDPPAIGSDPPGPAAERSLFWHLPHYHHSTPAGAIRRGDWKLIEWFEDDTTELFHLADDPGETTDLAAQRPAMVTELRASLADWRRQVNAQMPVANPDHDPLRADELARPARR